MNEPVSPNGSDEPSVAVAAVVVGVVAAADVAVVAKLTVAVLNEHKHLPRLIKVYRLAVSNVERCRSTLQSEHGNLTLDVSALHNISTITAILQYLLYAYIILLCKGIQHACLT